ncbi:MAG: acyl carrier protein [Planctomycetota bacterium]|jgi:acyl carrier protein
MSYTNKIRDFVVENFLFGDGQRLNDDTSFIEEGIIDSSGFLELAMFLEETFGIGFEDEELIPENIDSLQNITRFVARKLDRDATAEG